MTVHCPMQAIFYHKASKTLLVTDAVVYISSDPPEVMLKISSSIPSICICTLILRSEHQESSAHQEMLQPGSKLCMGFATRLLSQSPADSM